MTPRVEILLDDGGVLVKGASGEEARRLALAELRDQGWSPGDAEEYLAKFEPVSGLWRKIPPSVGLQDEGYGWVLAKAKKGFGAFQATVFLHPTPEGLLTALKDALN